MVNENMENDRSTRCLIFKTKVQPFLYKHCLMLGIICILIIGLTFPQPGDYVGRFKGSSYICVIMIFLHSGLKLRTAEAKTAISNYKAFIWGILSTLLFSSIIGSKLTQLLPFEEPASFTASTNSNSTTNSGSSIVGPGEFQIGLELYFISPCAIASGIILVSTLIYNIVYVIVLAVV